MGKSLVSCFFETQCILFWQVRLRTAISVCSVQAWRAAATGDRLTELTASRGRWHKTVRVRRHPPCCRRPHPWRVAVPGHQCQTTRTPSSSRDWRGATADTRRTPGPAQLETPAVSATNSRVKSTHDVCEIFNGSHTIRYEMLYYRALESQHELA